jgi:hypothetical protein
MRTRKGGRAMIRNFESGEYGEYIVDLHHHPKVKGLRGLCQIPAPAAVAWVKADPKMHAALPKVECKEDSAGEFHVRGWMNKGFVIGGEADYKTVIALYHHDFTFYLYEILLK